MQQMNYHEIWICQFSSSITEKFVPQRAIRINQKPQPPWMTLKVKQKTIEKWEAFRAMKQNNNNMTRNHYAKLKNQTKWEVRKAVRSYEKKIAQESKQNPKAFFSYAKSKVKVQHAQPYLGWPFSPFNLSVAYQHHYCPSASPLLARITLIFP